MTLSSDATGGPGGDSEISSEESELRLRRSLEMLGSGAKREPVAREATRDGFRDAGRDSGREPVRDVSREMPREAAREGFREPFRDHGRDQSGRDHAKGASFTPSGARRHRFKDDGEVPVVHVAAHRDRSQPGFPGAGSGGAQAPQAVRGGQFQESQIAEERAAREKAERALEAARESVHHLQTRVGHAELALREAVGQVEARDRSIAALQLQVSEEQEGVAAARRDAAHADKSRREAEAKIEFREEQHQAVLRSLKAEIASLRATRTAQPSYGSSNTAHAAAKPTNPISKRAAKIAVPVEDEEEPVQWWLTSEAKAKPASRRKS